MTGGSSGIGRAIALSFAREGAEVLLTYRRNAAGAQAVVDEVRAGSGTANAIEADVGDASGVEALVKQSFERLGRIDVWVNNGGADILTRDGPRLPDAERLDRALHVDLRGSVLACWAVAPKLRAQGGGTILNLSWDHALVGAPGREAEIYAAAKGGVLAFSKSLARSFAPEVRVNVLAPGWIATAFAEGLGPESRQRIADATPLRRWGTPEDVAQAAVFLASSESAFLTGATLLVGGGVVM